MDVILVLGTKDAPGPKVKVVADIRFITVEGFDKWLKAQKVARDWLAKELEK